MSNPIISVPKSVFNAVYLPHLQAQQRMQIFYGGSGSGKSVFLACRVVLDCLSGRNTLVVRQVAKTLRSSCFQEIIKSISRFNLSDVFLVNKSEMSITSKTNQSQILFLGLDDVEKIKSITPASGVLTDIWIEEATETSYQDFKQLEKRLRGRSRHLKRVTLSFNPISRGHWIYRQFFAPLPDASVAMHQDADLLILRTTYKDNKFLSADDVSALQAEQDSYFHSVYTLGEWGVLGGAVFSSWHEAQVFPMRLPVLRGLDFGYSADPAAAVAAYHDAPGKRIYVFSELYEKSLTNDILSLRLRSMFGPAPFFCDSAEPKSIAELRRHGLAALPARKGPDSVKHGLQYLMQHDFIIDPSCINFLDEFSSFCWKQDSDGQQLHQTQGADHLIDALRYAVSEIAAAPAAIVSRPRYA